MLGGATTSPTTTFGRHSRIRLRKILGRSHRMSRNISRVTVGRRTVSSLLQSRTTTMVTRRRRRTMRLVTTLGRPTGLTPRIRDSLTRIIRSPSQLLPSTTLHGRHHAVTFIGTLLAVGRRRRLGPHVGGVLIRITTGCGTVACVA